MLSVDWGTARSIAAGIILAGVVVAVFGALLRKV